MALIYDDIKMTLLDQLREDLHTILGAKLPHSPTQTQWLKNPSETNHKKITAKIPMKL
jgi:hypothetical protein